MPKYGLKFERKDEACEELLKTHHVFLSDDKRSFVRDENKHHNILIEGENLHALKILSYTHAGKVDCIAIDPPYNTGNKDFVYNDAFVDEEDSFRHSKWLSFMEKRLKIARTLLSERGVIFLHIDDNEFAQLKLLCDEVFGEKNFVANMVWKKKSGGGGGLDSDGIATEHEYILAYSKNTDEVKLNRIPSSNVNDDYYDLEDRHVKTRGRYRVDPLNLSSIQYSSSMDFDIGTPDGKKVFPGGFDKQGNGEWSWRWGKGKVQWGKENDFIEIHNGIHYYGWNTVTSEWEIRRKCAKQSKHPKAWKVYTKRYQFVDNEGKKLVRTVPMRSIVDDIYTISSSAELKALDIVFDYAKPVELIKRLLFVATQKDSIILDFFAGSGTTGQAVAEINKEDGGTRQFILVTNNDKSEKLPDGICAQVTFPRLEKTIGNENLKVFQVKQLKMKGGNVSNIEQLELNNRLLPTMCLANNTFVQVEKTKQSAIFTDPKQKLHLGVWSNTDDVQKSPVRKELTKFEKKLNKMSKKTKLLVNRPRRGFACEYYEFMKS